MQHALAFTTDAVLVAIEAVRVGCQHREASIGNIAAIQIGRWRWDAHARIRRIAIAQRGGSRRLGRDNDRHDREYRQRSACRRRPSHSRRWLRAQRARGACYCPAPQAAPGRSRFALELQEYLLIGHVRRIRCRLRVPLLYQFGIYKNAADKNVAQESPVLIRLRHVFHQLI